MPRPFHSKQHKVILGTILNQEKQVFIMELWLLFRSLKAMI